MKQIKSSNDILDDIAIESAALFFQEEMLKEEEEIDLLLLNQEIELIIEHEFPHEFLITWRRLYPILKRCVR